MAETSKDPFAAFDTVDLPKSANETDKKIAFCNSYQQDSQIDSLMASMSQYDKNTINTQLIRQTLANKLLNDVLKMDLNVVATTNPDLFAAQARMIAEARGLLNDMDTSSRNHTAIKLKQKDTETQADAVLNAAELLTKIKLTVAAEPAGVTQSADVIEDAIMHQFEENGCVVPDTELEMGGNNLPHKKEEEE